MDQLKKDYPWTKAPLVSCGPMRLIALASLAAEISRAGGLGFVGAGSDVSTLDSILTEVKQMQSTAQVLKDVKDVLPVGVGFLLWAGEKLLNEALPLLEKYKPAAVWLFAPSETQQFVQWTEEVRRVTDGKTKIWIQIGTVAEALEVTQTCQPDVLVVQGQDAGGHGLEKAAGLVPLLPEVDDELSALCSTKNLRKPVLIAGGGIMDGRGAAAAIALGAAGVTMGTRYLAAPEANIAKGYRDAVLHASDGGVWTKRVKLYDTLRGTRDWPERYGGRGVLNESFFDAEKGMSAEENQKLYDEAMKKGDEGWGEKARLATYAGAGVGLMKNVKSAARITDEVREDAKRILKQASTIAQLE
ncbi:related to FMN-dependent 2-nitropropane dioxygenase [Ramularia collo-cygni]|uniref:Related to FMN-dependent 2-nitropropane dioxygenase n=1 Tax=Ramularia collo-cygni TaxID=112498 RepID=A0A2D3UQU2_9PEZI|nr:related to FMN-dependent 2-nitropropane dioxygenase [Ramularia collo-cygni]CZT18211.1 related to FMN-dependent 2-nitropropane dioxygenase [Ramularia collo-cygni]